MGFAAAVGRSHIPPVDSTDRNEAIDAARRAGIDLHLVDSNLALPVKERWRQHDAALAFILKLEEAKRKHDTGLQPAAREISR